eukprot:CAMPEP_0206487750 /NCGR_PEP_ID=MMETSP0324_2-20121206/41880_1 /ASSEMBLY_ACC=CAM_ASM_000836 /TAXON_ID=2866 /ORGANISM="Crypthecodinium cohnii, Strain Seligo" /LENGTH=101 /DNA_ID=CAMNT_0053966397 /DNA_START=32 /DNA_END=339 /DNA_ORIENTATION=-
MAAWRSRRFAAPALCHLIIEGTQESAKKRQGTDDEGVVGKQLTEQQVLQGGVCVSGGSTWEHLGEQDIIVLTAATNEDATEDIETIGLSSESSTTSIECKQ